MTYDGFHTSAYAAGPRRLTLWAMLRDQTRWSTCSSAASTADIHGHLLGFLASEGIHRHGRCGRDCTQSLMKSSKFLA